MGCPANPLDDRSWRGEIFLTTTAITESAFAREWSGNSVDPRETLEGAFHFGRLIDDLRGRDGRQQNEKGGADLEFTPYGASEYTHRWLDEWAFDDTVNCDKVPARPAVDTELRDLWPTVPDAYDVYVHPSGTRFARKRLDMTKPPFRLLAIVLRPDLADLAPPHGAFTGNDEARDPLQAGELRLVYGLVDPKTGAAKNFTIAFEFSLPAKGPGDVTNWHTRWHRELASVPFESKLWVDRVARLVLEVTRNNGARSTATSMFPAKCLGCSQARPHDSNLHQVRTNDFKVLGATQEFREFRIPLTPPKGKEGGALAHFYLQQTFQQRLQGSPKLAHYLTDYCEPIRQAHHKVPQDFPRKAEDSNDCDEVRKSSVQAGHITNDFASWWTAPPEEMASCKGLEFSKNELRHRFSRNTCNGCHGYEMGFRTESVENNFMVRPRAANQETTVSRFLDGTLYEVQDPEKKELWRPFNERRARLARYREAMCGYRSPDWAEPLKR